MTRRPARPSSPSSVLALVLAAAAGIASGCPKSDDAPQTTAGAEAGDDGKAEAGDDGFRTRAHEQALARFLEASTKALRLADPLAAHRLDASVVLGPPPLSRSARAPLREAVDAALQEGEGIDRKLLSAEQAMLYEAVWRGLLAVQYDLDRVPALRRDPTLFAWRSRPLVDHVVARVVTGRPCDGCAAGLTALGSELRAAAGQLGATSPASLAAAEQDLAALRVELTELAAREGTDAAIAAGAKAAADGVDAVQQRLTAIAAALAEAPQVQWQTPVPGATKPEAVKRLPDRIGDETLARRLTQEEQLRLTPEQVAGEITLMLLRLKTMAEAHAKTHGPAGPPLAATMPSAARCTAAWTPLSTWAAGNDAIAAPVKSAAFDCATRVHELGSAPLTDVELSLAVFELGILEPTRWARRAAVDRSLGLVHGDMAPAGQRLALTTSGLFGAGQPATTLAIAQADRALCVALAGVLEHGGLLSEDGRAERLKRDCPEHDADALVAEALARPRQAIAPAGLVLIGKGPAQAVALSRFWWAPLGLVMPLADPARSAPPDPATLPEPELIPLDPKADPEAAENGAAP